MINENVSELRWRDVDLTIEVYDDGIIMDRNKFNGMYGWLLNKEKLDDKEVKLLAFFEECIKDK